MSETNIAEWLELELEPAEIKTDRNGIHIPVGYDYLIAWDRISTQEQILQWTLQIGRKPWATAAMLVQIIQAARSHHRIKIFHDDFSHELGTTP